MKGKKKMAQVKCRFGNVEVVVTGDLKQTVRELGMFAEFYGADARCRMCESENLVPNFRQAGGYDWYELTCKDCGGRLGFGQTKEGGKLFPHRKLEDGSWDKDKQGWKPAYEKREGQSSQSSPQASQTQSNFTEGDPEPF